MRAGLARKHRKSPLRIRDPGRGLTDHTAGVPMLLRRRATDKTDVEELE